MFIRIKIIFLYFLLIGLFACQPIEKLEQVVFDYEVFSKFVVSAESKSVFQIYESKISEPYIDHSIKKPPVDYLKEWISSNINIIGSENLYVINIIDASIIRSEIPNSEFKKYEEKTIYSYKINLTAEYILYDDSNSILAKVLVETQRTTTSGKFISLF